MSGFNPILLISRSNHSSLVNSALFAIKSSISSADTCIGLNFPMITGNFVLSSFLSSRTNPHIPPSSNPLYFLIHSSSTRISLSPAVFNVPIYISLLRSTSTISLSIITMLPSVLIASLILFLSSGII